MLKIKKSLILAIIGDRFHNKNYIEKGLKDNIFLSDNENVKLITRSSKIKLGNNLKNIDLLIVFKEGRKEPKGFKLSKSWLSLKEEKVLENYVKSGGGLLSIHNGISMYPQHGPYRKLTSGHFIWHPPIGKFTVYPLNNLHPITAGIKPFTIKDEQYFVNIDGKEVKVILTSSSREHGHSPSGWCKEYGRGRVCCLTPGHSLVVLKNKKYQRLISNAVLWCLKR